MSSSDAPDKESVRTLVHSCLDFVEESILTCVLRDYRFWTTLSEKVNTKIDKFNRHEDFVKPAYNQIYAMADNYYRTFKKDGGPVTLEVLLNVLGSEWKSGKLSQDDFTTILRLAPKFWEPNVDALLPLATNCLSTWLEMKRTLHVAAEVSKGKSLSAEDVIAQLQHIRRTTTDDERVIEPTPLQALNQAKQGVAAIETYPLGSLGEFNMPLGGGLVPGEMGLIITPPNGGKTVLANQIAADVALSRRNVLLITTEQTTNQMYWRQYANIGNIDFAKLALGYDPEKMADRENERIEKYATRVDPYMRISDWSQNPSTIATGLEPLLDDYIDGGWTPSVVVFDWLGGGLSNEDDDNLAQHMIQVSKHLRGICKERNISVVVFAQASEKEVRGVTKVTGAHVYACKMLHTYADWGCGISLLRMSDRASTATASGNGDDVCRTQWFNFFKTRNAPTGAFKFERDFKFQRWRPESMGAFHSDPLNTNVE